MTTSFSVMIHSLMNLWRSLDNAYAHFECNGQQCRVCYGRADDHDEAFEIGIAIPQFLLQEESIQFTEWIQACYCATEFLVG
jgi:hypothetical protein